MILAARHGQAYSRAASSPAVQNYKLLCLKRHQKSSFMPGLYVFPGGAIDPADANLKWLEYFTGFGLGDNRLASLIPRTISRPQIFHSRENELLREISLRITAIRETFEECGILICRRDKDGGANSGWAEYISVPKDELRIWRNKVHNNATEFLNLCQKFECYPDLWALHEWRNWLTPTIRYDKRFNTAFYLACLPDIPHAEYEAQEMEDLKWDTPEKLASTDIMFPPPQQCEIAKLIQVRSVDDLLDIAVERNKKGAELYLPISVYLKDGVIHVLPGDTMYPKKVELVEKQIIDKTDITIKEFQKISPVKNRVEFLDMQAIYIDNVSGKESCVSFSMPRYSKKVNDNKEPKNKL